MTKVDVPEEREDRSSKTASAAGKVATVTLAFWIMKICATTLGETGGDMLSQTMNVGYAASSLILISIFLVALILQLRAKSFHPVLYWIVILATSTAGTTMSDFMDRTLDLGYALGSSILVGLLIVVLLIWRFTVGSLAVDHIRSVKVEIFYWTAILVSNTLGTALGDFLSDSSDLGFLKSNLIISSAILLIALAYYFTKISRTGLFWVAFVLTRPFGATMGDLLTKGTDKGGLGFGTIGSSAVLGVILIALVAFSMRKPRIEATA
jgi:uncharacterized membrane-anchored protein